MSILQSMNWSSQRIMWKSTVLFSTNHLWRNRCPPKITIFIFIIRHRRVAVASGCSGKSAVVAVFIRPNRVYAKLDHSSMRISCRLMVSNGFMMHSLFSQSDWLSHAFSLCERYGREGLHRWSGLCARRGTQKPSTRWEGGTGQSGQGNSLSGDFEQCRKADIAQSVLGIQANCLRFRFITVND